MIRIVQYIQPWEIDDFERVIVQLIKSSYSISNSKEIILDVTLNLDIVDWNVSKIPKQYFLDKFMVIAKQASIHYTVEFDTDTSICGCTDKRRSIETKEQDYTIWLDSDMYFPVTLLPYMVNATQIITESDYILSPQLIKYWDSSWDVLTNERYILEPFNHRDYFDTYKLDYDSQYNETYIKPNLSHIKFGGGWFNLFTNSIFKKIPLPIEIGPYGPDDTFISHCATYLKIPQFILTGQVVSEVGKLYESNYIKPYLSVNIQNKQKITDYELYELINKFILKNKKNN
jgi:hypothetical protein